MVGCDLPSVFRNLRRALVIYISVFTIQSSPYSRESQMKLMQSELHSAREQLTTLNHQASVLRRDLTLTQEQLIASEHHARELDKALMKHKQLAALIHRLSSENACLPLNDETSEDGKGSRGLVGNG
eukprot:Colp12_sorted_trinity150504_noHs@24295